MTCAVHAAKALSEKSDYRRYNIFVFSKNCNYFGFLLRSIKKRLAHYKEKIDDLLEKLKLVKLKTHERHFVEECCSVIKRVACTLDKLQEENNCYFAYVAPTVIVDYRKLII